MTTQPNNGQVTRSIEQFNLRLTINEDRSQILMPSHWHGLMSVAAVLGVAWINLSQLPAHAVAPEQWVHLLRLLLLVIFVPLVTTGIYLLYRNDWVPKHTSLLQSDVQPSGSADTPSHQNAAQRISWNHVADGVSIATTLALILLDVVNFMTGRAYGTTTSVSWAVNVDGVMRHPVQLYSALALSILLLVLWRMRSRALPGEVLWRFVLFYSLIQLIVLDFCASAVIWGAGVRTEQVLSLIMLLGSMYVLSGYAQRRTDATTGELRREA